MQRLGAGQFGEVWKGEIQGSPWRYICFIIELTFTQYQVHKQIKNLVFYSLLQLPVELLKKVTLNVWLPRKTYKELLFDFNIVTFLIKIKTLLNTVSYNGPLYLQLEDLSKLQNKIDLSFKQNHFSSMSTKHCQIGVALVAPFNVSHSICFFDPNTITLQVPGILLHFLIKPPPPTPFVKPDRFTIELPFCVTKKPIN